MSADDAVARAAGWSPGDAVAAGLAVAASLVVSDLALRLRRRGRPPFAAVAALPVHWDGRDVAAVFLIGLSTALGAGVLLGRDAPLLRQLAASTVASLLATGLAILHLRHRGADARSLGLVCDDCPGAIRLAIASLAIVVAPLLGLAAVLDRLVPYRHPVVDLLTSRRDGWAVGLVVISAVFVAPLAEELFFRRVLQGWIEAIWPGRRAAGAAIAISAAAFAAAHVGQGLAHVPLFLLGIVLGFVARQGGSLVPAILLHALFNAVSVVLLLVGG